jgi:hypothetical protein
METRMLLRVGLAAAVLGVALSEARGAHAADPTTAQCIASSEHGQELRSAEKMHDAGAQFTLCAAAICPGPIREDCARRLDEVVEATPTIVFVVKDTAGNDARGVRVTVDGQPVAVGAAAAIEVDPGEHTFAFEQGDRFATEERRLVLVESVKGRRETVVLRETAAGLPRSETAQPASAAPTPRSGEPPRPGPPALAWVAFGVGGAGLAVGVIAGLVAGEKHSTLSSECNDGAGTCAQQYAGDLDGFHSARTWSTVGYVVGALGVAGGVTLWLTAPRARSATTASVWVGPAAAGVAGRF